MILCCISRDLPHCYPQPVPRKDEQIIYEKELYLSDLYVGIFQSLLVCFFHCEIEASRLSSVLIPILVNGG